MAIQIYHRHPRGGGTEAGNSPYPFPPPRSSAFLHGANKPWTHPMCTRPPVLPPLCLVEAPQIRPPLLKTRIHRTGK